MFEKGDPASYRTVLPGIRMKTLCYGRRTLMTEFVLEGGRTLPLHRHPHEQTGYLVKGHIRLTIDGQTHEAHPGDSWCVPADVEHGAQSVEDTVVVEIFSPVREDYLP